MAKILLERLKAKFGDGVLETSSFRGDEVAVIKPEFWKDAARFLRDDSACQCDYFVDLSAVDYPDRSRIQELLQNIQNTEEDLQTQQDDLNQKKQEADDTKTELQNRNNELSASESQKNALLVATQGEEAKYQQLLQRVQEAHAALPAVDDDYRTFLWSELNAWRESPARSAAA